MPGRFPNLNILQMCILQDLNPEMVVSQQFLPFGLIAVYKTIGEPAVELKLFSSAIGKVVKMLW